MSKAAYPIQGLAPADQKIMMVAAQQEPGIFVANIELQRWTFIQDFQQVAPVVEPPDRSRAGDEHQARRRPDKLGDQFPPAPLLSIRRIGIAPWSPTAHIDTQA